MWENNRNACKYLKSLSDDTERLLNELETAEGVLGATVNSFGASIVTLVISSLINEKKLKRLLWETKN